MNRIDIIWKIFFRLKFPKISGKNAELVNQFLKESGDEFGWLDIRSHPLGIEQRTNSAILFIGTNLAKQRRFILVQLQLYIELIFYQD